MQPHLYWVVVLNSYIDYNHDLIDSAAKSHLFVDGNTNSSGCYCILYPFIYHVIAS
jgi:hypothetical protein